jgi:hypothetical protein
MNKQKGIVFENTSSYSIFLTEDGRFQKGIPFPTSVQVGEEVLFRPYVTMLKIKPSIKPAWMAPLVAAVAIVLLFFSVLLPAQSKVSAFVQVDFNPSIELGIDEKGDVQQFKGLNEDGTALKREISFWKGKSLTSVLTTIVDHSIISTQNEKQFEITTIYKEDTSQDSLEKLIRTAVAESTSKLVTESVQVKEATVEDRSKANEKGISVDAYKQEMKNEEMKKQSPLPKVKENSKTKEKEHRKNQKQSEKEIKKEEKTKQKMKKKQKNDLQKNDNKYSQIQQEAKNSETKSKFNEKYKVREKNKDKEPDKDREKNRNNEQDIDREKNKYKEPDKDREKNRNEQDIDREKNKDKERDNDRGKNRNEQDIDREKNKDKEQDNDRGKNRKKSQYEDGNKGRDKGNKND